jgi:hypothetical protein
MEPLKPLLRKRVSGNSYAHNARLSLYDVQQIRKWAKGPGFGLTLAEQVRELQTMANYQSLAYATIRDVLANGSWFDPSYDRAQPSVLPTTATPSMITWLLFLLMLCRTAQPTTASVARSAISQ